MKNPLKQLVLNLLWGALGRRNLVRLGRFLSMEARLDLNGDIHSHGEAFVREIVVKNAPSDRHLEVLDVGANTGEWTEVLLEDCAHAEREDVYVHLFEPSRSTFRSLKERFETHRAVDRLIFQPLALSREPGHKTLHIVHELAGTNSLHEQPELAPVDQEEVELDTVDSYARRWGIEHIDLIKIDAEGHDLEVLAGARRLLAEQKIEVIQFEYSSRWIYARNYLRDAFELLHPLGYRLGKLTRKGIEYYEGWHPELETFREANYVACLPAWVERFPSLRWWNE